MTTQFTITVSVDDDDLAQYRGNLDEYLEARLDEVYGDEGTVLTTMHVVSLVPVTASVS